MWGSPTSLKRGWCHAPPWQYSHALGTPKAAPPQKSRWTKPVWITCLYNSMSRSTGFAVCVNIQARSRLLNLIPASPEVTFLAKSENYSTRNSTAQPHLGAQSGKGDEKGSNVLGCSYSRTSEEQGIRYLEWWSKELCEIAKNQK